MPTLRPMKTFVTIIGLPAAQRRIGLTGRRLRLVHAVDALRPDRRLDQAIGAGRPAAPGARAPRGPDRMAVADDGGGRGEAHGAGERNGGVVRFRPRSALSLGEIGDETAAATHRRLRRRRRRRTARTSAAGRPRSRSRSSGRRSTGSTCPTRRPARRPRWRSSRAGLVAARPARHGPGTSGTSRTGRPGAARRARSSHPSPSSNVRRTERCRSMSMSVTSATERTVAARRRRHYGHTGWRPTVTSRFDRDTAVSRWATVASKVAWTRAGGSSGARTAATSRRSSCGP